MADAPLSSDEMERYTRHMALPDFGVAEQMTLKSVRILMVGAGGLGAPALPYLAGAGIGHITICDDDDVSISNLHRQTIYKNAEDGQSKAELAAAYAQNLNPNIEVRVITSRLRHPEERQRRTDLNNAQDQILHCVQDDDFSVIFDGTDNFETKTLLNQISIETKTPLISASVNQYNGQCGIFAGYAADMPCYSCLFPELPNDARNCNEAGVLGTAAGLTGLYQAHLTILLLANLKNTAPGTFLSFDFAQHRLQTLSVHKNKNCAICSHNGEKWQPQNKKDKTMSDMITFDDLKSKDHIIVDVRTDGEIANDPIPADVLHIEVSEIPARHEELPKDKLCAFVCAGNIRSVQAVEYLSAMGYENIIVLDKFSVPAQ